AQKPDAECREDLPEGRQGGRHGMADRQVPGPRPGDHGEQVEQGRDDHPTPANEVERVVHGVPVRPTPPDGEDREHEGCEDEQASRPWIPGERNEARHAATTSADRGRYATSSALY